MKKETLMDIVVYSMIAICLTATLIGIQYYGNIGINLYTHPTLPIYDNPLLWLALIGIFTLIYSFKTYFEVYEPVEENKERKHNATHK